MSNGLKVALLALACFATSISEFAIAGMIDAVAESAGVNVAMAGQLLTALAAAAGALATKPADAAASSAAAQEA